MKQQKQAAPVAAIDAIRVVVGDQALLMPMSAVGEVVRGTAVQATKPGDPKWLYGWLQWRKTTIPLVSFEMMSGKKKAEINGVANVLVVNTLGRAKGLEFYALLLNDLPQPARIFQDGDLAVNAKAKLQAYQLMHVTLDDEPLIIPNLEALETDIRAAL